MFYATPAPLLLLPWSYFDVELQTMHRLQPGVFVRLHRYSRASCVLANVVPTTRNRCSGRIQTSPTPCCTIEEDISYKTLVCSRLLGLPLLVLVVFISITSATHVSARRHWGWPCGNSSSTLFWQSCLRSLWQLRAAYRASTNGSRELFRQQSRPYTQDRKRPLTTSAST